MLDFVLSVLTIAALVLSMYGTVYGAWLIHPFLMGIVCFGWFFLLGYTVLEKNK